ncbi:TIGR04206 family protein [Halomarina litorea]|uniref:TIGR04206 family protein n=1 Tax=Halomarina litorea TaxID=2961595 RepID=UPI0020C28347|nr:TIGR04206 family protein [Halomarina sp. BCD28]
MSTGSDEESPFWSPGFDPRAARRLLLLVALAFVPWTVILGPDLTLVFPFGLVNDNPWFLVRVDDYLRLSSYGRFAFIDAWLIGAGLYAVALLSALGGVAGVEDRRLTGGLLVFAGVSQFPLALGFSRRTGYVGLPVGSLFLLAAAWWLYWSDVRAWVGARVE